VLVQVFVDCLIMVRFLRNISCCVCCDKVYSVSFISLHHFLMQSGSDSEYLFMHLYPSEVLIYRAHPSEGGDGNSVVRETWFLLLIGGTVLTLVLGFIGMLYLRRRQALSKELGHLNGLCNLVDISPFYYRPSDLRARGQKFGLSCYHNIFNCGQFL
jgi:hypothetical protein